MDFFQVLLPSFLGSTLIYPETLAQDLISMAAAEENKILARWAWEPRLLGRAGDTSQGSREKQARTLQCHRTAETIYLSKPLGNAFPIGPGILFLFLTS